MYFQCKCAEDLGLKVDRIVVIKGVSKSSRSQYSLGNAAGEHIPRNLSFFPGFIWKRFKENKCFSPGLTAYPLSAFIQDDNRKRKKNMWIIRIAYSYGLT